jgi:Type IX secretion system membrane protein PorP/SprF
MKSVVWYILLFCTSLQGVVVAQGTPYIQIFPYNWQLVNASMVEPSLFIHRAQDRPQSMVSLGYRHQWIGREDAPITTFGSFEWSSKNRGNPSQKQPLQRIGGHILIDKAGAFESQAGYINFTSFISLPGRRHLHIGIMFGGINTIVNRAELRWADPNDPKINDLPPNKGRFDAGFGLTYRFEFGRKSPFERGQNFGYIGLSVPGLPIRSFLSETESLRSKIQLSQVNIIAGAHIVPDGQDYFCKWEPFLWIRGTPPGLSQYRPFPLGIDANLRCYINNEKIPLWFGGGYGTNRLFRAELGWQGLPLAAEIHKRLRVGLLLSWPLFTPHNLGQSFELTSSYVIQ